MTAPRWSSTSWPPRWPPCRPLGGWVLEASCAQLGPGADIFVAEGRIDLEELEVARAVCAGCPVVQECGEYAAQTPVYGLWGGRWYEDSLRARRAA